MFIFSDFISFVCSPQDNMLWWQPTSTWRGKLVTLWSRHIYPASWQSSSPKCLSGSTENPSLPGLSLVSSVLSSRLNICGFRNEPVTRFQISSWKIYVEDMMALMIRHSLKIIWHWARQDNIKYKNVPPNGKQKYTIQPHNLIMSQNDIM